MKKVELTLPEFAFVESAGHEEDNQLEGRNVIIHIRSMSIVEVLERDRCRLYDDVLSLKFTYTNRYDLEEKMVMVLHHCGTFDKDLDRQLIIDEIMKPAAKWYADYCDWEDKNIEAEGW